MPMRNFSWLTASSKTCSYLNFTKLFIEIAIEFFNIKLKPFAKLKFLSIQSIKYFLLI